MRDRGLGMIGLSARVAYVWLGINDCSALKSERNMNELGEFQLISFPRF